MSTISELEIKRLTKEQNYIRGYNDGKSDVLNKIRAEIANLEEGTSSYFNDRPWVFKDEVLQIIDKYKEGTDKKHKEWPHKPCINCEDGCEEWAGCPCVYYKSRKRG